ncbi:MAG: diacylglycerol kinase family protein [Bryobacteraceae bacterium]|nr:diacylglycerol kinase family protein [Bryobacteraceae bacterium]
MNVLLWQVGAHRIIRTYQQAAIIYNPNAGRLRRHPSRLARAEAALKAAGHKITLAPTSRQGHATEIAREMASGGADLVLAAGGDGTINEVLNGLVGSEVALGILPFGTANVLAMETGIGSHAVRAAERVASWEPVRISVGLLSQPGVAKRHFLLMAGAGLDAHIVANLNPTLKNMLGKASYWVAGFSSLLRRFEEMQVSANGREYRCGFALASRVRNYGGDLEIALGASLLADDVELMLFEGAIPFRYLKYFTGVVLGNTARMSGVHAIRANSFDLRPLNGRDVHIQLDGEDCGLLPAHVEVVPGAVTLLLPAEFLASERKRWTT